ncbi:MAG: sensor histidine kinase [Microbacteriaceae bacterium]
MTMASASRRRALVARWAPDVATAVVVLALAAAPFPSPEYRPVTPLAIASAFAPALVVPARRRWPFAALALAVGLFGLAAFTGWLSPGAVVACAVSVFGIARHTDRRTTVLTTTAAVSAVLVLTLLAASWNLLDPRLVQVDLALIASAAAGDAARSRRAYIQAITDRAMRAEQTRDSEARRRVTEERLRIARDLHDAVAHQIAVISLSAGMASTVLRSDPDSAERALASIRAAARTVLGEIGDLLQMLRNDDSAREDADAPGLEAIAELVDRFAAVGLDVSTIDGVNAGAVPRPIELVAYRVIQEGLANAHKHGAGGKAELRLTMADGWLRVSVTNRCGTAVAGRGSGHGLVGIRERVAAAGGTVHTARRNGWFRLWASLPLDRSIA